MLENVYLLIGASVLMHVAWNLLARQVDGKANFLWWGLLAHLVLLGPYALWHLLRHAEWEWPLLIAALMTAAANTLYFIALRRAYHYAPVALVYPLARSSPLLIAIWAWLFFSQPLSGWEVFTIGLSIVGLWILAASSQRGDAKQALPWTALAALATSIYSLSDKVAVDYLSSFSQQLGFITLGYSASFIGLTVIQYRETGQWRPAKRPPWRYILLGGLCIGTAYALVVRAMSALPAAHVVSFTNFGIVLAVILSISIFKEREHWRSRLVGSLFVSAGLVLLGSL